jgi:hypothetical protein
MEIKVTEASLEMVKDCTCVCGKSHITDIFS